MKFNLKFNDIDEERNLNENYSIKNLFDDLSVSSQTIVAKQNGEIAVKESVINNGDTIQLIQIIYGG
ncbi:MoaD/ThiS family protein [Methanobrevibacter sp. UBA188]|uniref:MoaD/ThiS family protein n=1 Tax=Methanobrevibacter sp. UBA188 TaxID=1915473 RepID=UPI0025D9F644|nr:MoaD/ThiS family protein [Methanobrevibacter sp. UBA188]